MIFYNIDFHNINYHNILNIIYALLLCVYVARLGVDAELELRKKLKWFRAGVIITVILIALKLMNIYNMSWLNIETLLALFTSMSLFLGWLDGRHHQEEEWRRRDEENEKRGSLLLDDPPDDD